MGREDVAEVDGEAIGVWGKEIRSGTNKKLLSRRQSLKWPHWVEHHCRSALGCDWVNSCWFCRRLALATFWYLLVKTWGRGPVWLLAVAGAECRLFQNSDFSEAEINEEIWARTKTPFLPRIRWVEVGGGSLYLHRFAITENQTNEIELEMVLLTDLKLFFSNLRTYSSSAAQLYDKKGDS